MPYLKNGFQGDFPLPRAEHIAVPVFESSMNDVDSEGNQVIEEVLYIFGGNTFHYGLNNDLYSFHLPRPKLYEGPPDDKPEVNGSYSTWSSPRDWRWELEWKLLDSTDGDGNIPSRRAAHSSVRSIDGYGFYIFGGRAYNPLDKTKYVGLNDVWYFSTNKMAWESIRPLAGEGEQNVFEPIGREHAAMTIVDDRMSVTFFFFVFIFMIFDLFDLFCLCRYVFGGVDPSSGFCFNDVSAYSLALRKWELLFAAQPPHTDGYRYSFHPPPLSNSHLIPFNNRQESDGITFENNEHNGFLVYGGVGGGGLCGHTQSAGEGDCNPEQTALGQIYRFSTTENKWIAPHSLSGSSEKDKSQLHYSTGSDWTYARISSHQGNGVEITTQGKMIKGFALEGICYVPSRRLMYEFGGIKSVLIDPRVGNEQEDTDQPMQYSILETSAAGNLYEPYYDPHTGEKKRNFNDIPTNSYWSYEGAFYPFPDGTSDATSRVQLLRSFRVYSVAPNDIVLIKEINEKKSYPNANDPRNINEPYK